MTHAVMSMMIGMVVLTTLEVWPETEPFVLGVMAGMLAHTVFKMEEQQNTIFHLLKWSFTYNNYVTQWNE